MDAKNTQEFYADIFTEAALDQLNPFYESTTLGALYAFDYANLQPAIWLAITGALIASMAIYGCGRLLHVPLAKHSPENMELVRTRFSSWILVSLCLCTTPVGLATLLAAGITRLKYLHVIGVTTLIIALDYQGRYGWLQLAD